jgi:NTE family protein
MAGGVTVKIGLALGGGAARGITHIGVLQYLEERGVKPCCIAGTSAGSIVAALYCSGKSIEELIRIATVMTWKDLIRISFPRKGLIRSSQLHLILKGYLGDVTFAELQIPLVVNAVDLRDGEEVLIEQGPVVDAVTASCAIPGIFSPVRWNQRLLVDGGLLDNVPSAHMGHKDIDYVIAVNVTAHRSLKKEPANIFEVLIQSYYILLRQRDIPACKHADILIEPDLGEFSFWDTGKSRQLIREGYKAAAVALGDVDLKRGSSRFARWLKRSINSKGRA